jgi:hypothetical protein
MSDPAKKQAPTSKEWWEIIPEAWVVSEGQDWEGCYEHFGPFFTEAEAKAFAAKKQAKQPRNGVLVYSVWPLSKPR